jgi:hypothetical protein
MLRLTYQIECSCCHEEQEQSFKIWDVALPRPCFSGWKKVEGHDVCPKCDIAVRKSPCDPWHRL